MYYLIYAALLFIIKNKIIQTKYKPQMWRRCGIQQTRWKRQGFLSDKRVTLQTADCIIYTHLLPAAGFGRYTCSVRLSEMIYDGPFAYTKRIDYWDTFPLSSHISPIVVESSILPVRWKSAFLCQLFSDIGGNLHLTTRYDWNISKRMDGFYEKLRGLKYTVSSYVSPSSSRNKMLFKSDNSLWKRIEKKIAKIYYKILNCILFLLDSMTILRKIILFII